MHDILYIDTDWTLFLDRDGVINKRLEGYVEDPSQFELLPEVDTALRYFSEIFERIIIVTNQQGIGKEIMTHEQLHSVHTHFLKLVDIAGARIDSIYYCPHLAVYEPACRKPNPGMALQAQAEYPKINFRKSIMIGDTESDMQFGKRLGMTTFYVNTQAHKDADYLVSSLYDTTDYIKFKN